MNWSRASEPVMAGEHGYKVAKFLIVDQALYRASLSGKFLGSVQDSFEGAAQVCDSHFQIMGEEIIEDEE